jgi:3-dehydroquinate synthase
MHRKNFQFSQASVDYFFEGGFNALKQLVNPATTVIITDENVFSSHHKKLKNWKLIVLKPGEKYKVQDTVNSIIKQLIEYGVDRKTTIVGVGGGVVTDMTGYVASIYMRGIRFGFVPTTLLAMVDASIGGKNGIDIGLFKNMVGIIRQPSFLLYDVALLSSLPEKELRNGFAEVIKHASIKDSVMFHELEITSMAYFKRNRASLDKLIQRNALLKTKIVQKDEFEIADRKLLNFGHTIGHALETQYKLSHGEAISVGMAYASSISSSLVKFKDEERVISLLDKFGLPTSLKFNKDRVFNVLKMDKKKDQNSINFILLKKIGNAIIKELPVDQIYSFL